MHVCTIIAKNYLAFARVLGRSLAENAPGVRFSVLVIDAHEGYIGPSREPFELITPADLELPEFGRMAAMYDVLELSTAVKPWLLRRLLARADGGSVVYLDPDIEIFSPLDELDERIREHGLVLTPHATAPMPRDGRRPTEQDILIAGAFNLGFIGLRPD